MDRRRRLWYLIKQIHLSMETVFNNALKEENITKSQADVLRYLHMNKDERITQKDIERYFDISNPTVTGILNRLEAKDLIVRSVDSTDARVRLVTLSKHGEETFYSFVKKLEDNNEMMMSAVALEDWELLLDMLNLILDKVDDIRRNS